MNLDRISFYAGDGFALVDEYIAEEHAAFYVDLPYLKAARRRYRNWQVDHRHLFEKMAAVTGSFLMSYDNNREIQDMAREFVFESRPVRPMVSCRSHRNKVVAGKFLKSWWAAFEKEEKEDHE